MKKIEHETKKTMVLQSKRLKKASFGFFVGIIGLVLMSLGATTQGIWLFRTGIVITTIGGWLIAWN